MTKRILLALAFSFSGLRGLIEALVVGEQVVTVGNWSEELIASIEVASVYVSSVKAGPLEPGAEFTMRFSLPIASHTIWFRSNLPRDADCRRKLATMIEVSDAGWGSGQG